MSIKKYVFFLFFYRSPLLFYVLTVKYNERSDFFMALGNKEIMSRNIKYYLQKSGKTRNDLVADLNLKYMTVSDWINGKTYPRIDKIEMLANYFGVMKSDLVEDRSTAQQIVENYIVDKIVDTVKELAPEPYQRNVLTCAERQLEEQKQAKKRLAEVHEVSVQYFAYNYYDQPVSAGTGQYLNEVQIETIQLPVKVDADFVCPIYGDSMEPDYKSGDYVFVKLTVELPSGTVGVFDYEGEAYIKQLIIEKDKAYLRSFNKKYKDIPINSDSDFRIIGKVVDVYRGK